MPAVTLPVKAEKAKQKNAPRFIQPSRKIAITPAYSETSAPKATSRNGEAITRISKIIQFLSLLRSFFCSIMNCAETTIRTTP